MIIENPTEFESFLEKYRQSDCIIIPILSDTNSPLSITALASNPSLVPFSIAPLNISPVDN